MLIDFAVGRLPWLRCGAFGDRVCRQGGDGGGGSGGEVSRGWEGRGSYGLVVIGDEVGDDGRTNVEGLLYVVRTRMWRVWCWSSSGRLQFRWRSCLLEVGNDRARDVTPALLT